MILGLYFFHEERNIEVSFKNSKTSLAPSRSPDGRDARATTKRDVIQDLGITNARHDLVCLHLHDPRESQLPDAGLLTIEDAETSEILELDSSRGTVRQRFASFNKDRLTQLDQSLNRTAVDTLRLNTTEPFAQTLQRFFEIRRGRRRR